ncbi:DUF2752 domain-containing protein [Mucilaginibacter terrenus]|uniref:DUF2752 domain-containing protein n=1 Tax=Mucilaginibacter terrenus TaxID=2482727 RepID=A0A3E2NJM4_9SPHI|nr:DUF2752 domain-containing protein [Mucilaginibacter terrenus]RFZ81197.1 DUF2752 domain-containing protein [Mucilaginibacter terrenus]
MLNSLYIPCNLVLFGAWLQGYLLPCPFKFLTGIDCPGCGFQRSVLALLQGNLHQSFILYPATIPLLVVFAYSGLERFWKLDDNRSIIKKTIYISMASVILVSYCLKMTHTYLH